MFRNDSFAPQPATPQPGFENPAQTRHPQPFVAGRQRHCAGKLTTSPLAHRCDLSFLRHRCFRAQCFSTSGGLRAPQVRRPPRRAEVSLQRLPPHLTCNGHWKAATPSQTDSATEQGVGTRDGTVEPWACTHSVPCATLLGKLHRRQACHNRVLEWMHVQCGSLCSRRC